MKPGSGQATKSKRYWHTFKTAQAILREKHALMSWREMAKELEFNKGILSAIVSGNRRASDRLILKINEVYKVKLSLNPQPIPVCQKCGKPHEMLKKCGPRKAKEKSKPEVSLYWKKDKPLSLGQYAGDLPDWLTANAAELVRRVTWAENKP